MLSLTARVTLAVKIGNSSPIARLLPIMRCAIGGMSPWKRPLRMTSFEPGARPLKSTNRSIRSDGESIT